MVGRSPDLVDALRTPGPDGRADKVHRLDARRTQVLLQPQVEIRRINPHKHVRAVLQQTRTQLPADGQDVPQTHQHLKAVAMHGQPLTGPQRLKTALLHVGPTNAQGLHLRPLALQTIQKQTGEQVS